MSLIKPIVLDETVKEFNENLTSILNNITKAEEMANAAQASATNASASASSASQASETAIETLRATTLIANSGNADALSTANAADIIELNASITKTDKSIRSGVYDFPEAKGWYISLGNYNIGDIVDLTPISHASLHSFIIIENISKDERFFVNLTDGNAARPWAFLDASNKLLSVATSPYATDTTLIAPADNCKLVLQVSSAALSAAKAIRYTSLMAIDSNNKSVRMCAIAPANAYKINITDDNITIPLLTRVYYDNQSIYRLNNNVTVNRVDKSVYSEEWLVFNKDTKEFLCIGGNVGKLEPNQYLVATLSSRGNGTSLPIQSITYNGNPIYASYEQSESGVVQLHSSKKALKEVAFTRKNSQSEINNCDIKLAFISDIHQYTDKLQRMKTLISNWGGFDAVVNGGDVVSAVLTENLDNYNSIVSSFGIPVLTAVGNHDAWKFRTPNDWSTIYIADKKDVYDVITSVVASTSNIVQPDNAEVNGYNYYFKDFNSKIRVIALDCMHWDDVQAAWFTSVLNAARASNLSVITVTHAPFDENELTYVDSIWNCKYRPYRDTTKTPIQCASIVKTFIDNGGQFVCWLVGHTHSDEILEVSNYGKQLIIVVNSPRQDGYTTTPKGNSADNYNYDSFNCIGVDTVNKQIKVVKVGADIDTFGAKHQMLVYDYATHKIVNEF